MVCPKCGSDKVPVKDNVNNTTYNEVYRKRVCAKCGNTFYTVEFEAEVNERFKDEWKQHSRY
jgi:transcriptional regulator NrdR family protein